MNEIATTTARSGRRCEVCALPAEIRQRIESALAQGQAFSRISRIPEAPSRDSIRRHVVAGHLPAAVQDIVERAHGLDAVAVAGRIADGARRAREAGLEAPEAGNVTLALRAIDVESRNLAMLSSLGIQREYDADLALGARDIARAALAAAQRHPEVAEAVAAELDRVYRADLADEVRDHANPDSRIEIQS